MLMLDYPAEANCDSIRGQWKALEDWRHGIDLVEQRSHDGKSDLGDYISFLRAVEVLRLESLLQ